MNQPKFAVSRFENRNGVMSWRVDGYVRGMRFRRNFKTREEAAAEKAAQEVRAEQNASGLHSVTTSLAVDQVREAEAVFRRLAGRPGTLGQYVDLGLAYYREPAKEMPLARAIEEYVALRESDAKQGNLSRRQFEAYRCELRALRTLFPRKTVAQLAPDGLTEFFKRGHASKKSYNNRRGLLSAFLKYCSVKDWISSNPIEKVPYFRSVGHQRGSAPSLSAAQCAEILEWAETNHQGALVPFIVLCLFAGIRPDLYVGEISKLRPTHVRLDTRVILIEPEVSKVRIKRNVTIQPNLAAWLRTYPLTHYPIMPRGFRRLRLEFRKRFNLSHDILRHTFISMFVGKFRSVGEAALQAGNSESIIRKHYLDLKTPEEAEQFFSIMPRHSAAVGSQNPNDTVSHASVAA